MLDPSPKQQTLTLQQALDLGAKHHSAGALFKAEDIYQQILQSEPNHPIALHLLGVIAHQKGKNDIAVDLITKAIAIKFDYAEAHNNLGLVLQDLEMFDDAVVSYRKALAIKPDFSEAHNNLGNVLGGVSRLDEAVTCYHKALAINPDDAKAHYNLGNALKELGQLDGAMASYHKAINIKPDYAVAHNNLGNTLRELNQWDKGVTSYHKALAIKPNFPEAYYNLGKVLLELGKIDEAVENYHRALNIKPDFSGAGKNLLLALLYVPGLTPKELFTEHLRFSEKHTRAIVLPAEGLKNDSTLGRRLRVGYLSSDFRDHPVGYNILPLLISHDREKIEVFCYADVRRPDGMTEKFRFSVDHWYTIVGKSDAEVAKMIRSDGVDVLVCLAGHFDGNRPLVCAHRAAPVQVSYHNGPTSGLEEMDYLLTDNFLNPPDTKEMFTEKLHRLPVFFQYPPIAEAPPVTAPPSIQVGFITFGSFNNPAKVNDEVIRLWGEVLKSVPGSRLLLKYQNWYSQASLQDRLLASFVACGIDQDRIKFTITPDTIEEHLRHYGEVDIALDPFPFNGATTTFQALWMGVPVVSLAGERFTTRISGSILHHGGLEELVVHTPEAYVACVRELSGDPVRLEALRANLREKVATSQLCDAATYARSVETAYREMWHKWCAGQDPIT